MATSKRKGIKSSAQDNFLEPNAVINLTATDVGTNRAYNNGAANLSWDLPAASPPATLYTITTSPTTTTQTTANKTFVFEGLASETAYTFTVVASNAAGNSLPATASVTATTVPSAPRNASASSPANNSDRVVWDAPAATGGKAVSSYTIVSSDGPSYPNSVSPKDIPETGNTTQTYTVYALNANGTSAGAATNSVTTFTPPHFPPFFPPFFPPYFPPFFPPFFPPHFPPFFPPYFPPFFPPFFPPYFPPFFPPHFPPFFPPFFPPYFPPFFPPHFPPFFPPYFAPPYFGGNPGFGFSPPYFPPRFGFRY
jgi:hypothetical protein